MTILTVVDPNDLKASNAKIEELTKKLAIAVQALEELATCEAAYRHNHDQFGRGHLKTGRAWDLMRRSGDAARDAIARIREPSKQR